MELADRTVMLLGGSGLVGHALARRVLAAAPGRLVLVALYEDEVRAAAEVLAPHRGRTMEIEGRPTGKDIVAALDAATAGPTYRAGILRHHAIARLKELERQHGDHAIAYEMLGPPRLTKLLYAAYLCGRLRSSVRALADSQATALAAEAHRLVEQDAGLRQQIVSVGLPIVAPDGKRVYRGSVAVVPPLPAEECDPLAAAPQASGSDVDWEAIGPDDPIEPSRFATWVFAAEDKGERIKR